MHLLPGRPPRGHFRWRSRPRQGCALRCSPGPQPQLGAPAARSGRGILTDHSRSGPPTSQSRHPPKS